jgi:ferredoxin
MGSVAGTMALPCAAVGSAGAVRLFDDGPTKAPNSGLPACIIKRMSLKILDTCVNCDVCEPACPNKAISLGEEFYVIDPDLCTECIGHHDEPQCVVVCPVECIITDPENVESHEQLDLKYRHLMAKESAA